jgi:hypothetical protein
MTGQAYARDGRSPGLRLAARPAGHGGVAGTTSTTSTTTPDPTLLPPISLTLPS